MGKSASGKDSIYKKIRERLSELKPIVIYTTRPIREGEREGVEYYFTDDNIGEAEYFVLITIMKELWVKSQITWDMNFKNPFFDKDIKGYSPAAMLTSMRNMAEAFEKGVDSKAILRYYKRNTDKVRYIK